MKKISLYIHIPFCVKKCGYCDFISFKYDESEKQIYLKHLKEEIKHYGSLNRKVHTIFIGGGTPSLLSGDEMIELMTCIRSAFDLSECVEISMESNPGTLSKVNLEKYKIAGINRISMGVQTLNDDTLLKLDRIHNVQTVYDSVALLKETGFDNFNMDLMFGLPGQSLAQLESTVDQMIKLNPAHISAYSLKFEEGTDFFRKLEAGEVEELEDELDREMYHSITNKLSAAGYMQYEISNYSKVGLECQHNLVYWEKEDYIGIGLGAHSCNEQERFYNTSEFEIYYELITSKGHAVIGRDEINESDDLFEYIMLNLRLNKGFEMQTINKKYGIDFESHYKEELKKLESDHLIVVDERIKLTDRGRDLSNQVFLSFLD